MKVDTIHKFEKAIVWFLNLDGWNLTHTGQEYEAYDAKGTTPKGRECVIEMKFRKTYYETKMLEVSKYKRLMDLDENIVKIYFVADPNGTYFFWLDGIENLKSVDKYCPRTTLWGSKKKTKEVYLLDESLASIVNKYDD
jgi:hypothetical protein